MPAARTRSYANAAAAALAARSGDAATANANAVASAADAQAAGSDVSGAFSGYGGGHGYGYIHEEECPEGIDEDLALLITAAAIAAGAFVVFRQVTIQQGGRKKRAGEAAGEHLASFVYSGKPKIIRTESSPMLLLARLYFV